MNILLVDDDRESRSSVAEFLRQAGHKVVECGSGYDALDRFCRVDFHLVLSDIKMPGMSGIELLRRIRRLPGGGTADFVLITGHGDMRSAIEALRAGARDYLLKPVKIEELVHLTERVAEHCALKPGKVSGIGMAGPGLEIVGVFSEAMQRVFRQAEIIHQDPSIHVLIDGETGTGKEVVARYIHHGKEAVDTPFVDINCAAIAAGLFESELFGYEAGAYTGGLIQGKKGKIDLAGEGTVFLDEIVEMPVDLQAKLLRVIQEKEFYRVGGLKKIKTRARFIGATNASIEEKIRRGEFRKDLYYRLSVGRIQLPPLRERREDIIPLAEMFLLKFAGAKGRCFRSISREAEEILLAYHWPGNVRELKNVMEWVVLMWDERELKPGHLDLLDKTGEAVSEQDSGLPAEIDCKNFVLPSRKLPLEDYQDRIILKALKMHRGNKTETAKYLGISRRSLYCRLQKIENRR
jgi:DNA-binding NtrC family response regulator